MQVIYLKLFKQLCTLRQYKDRTQVNQHQGGSVSCCLAICHIVTLSVMQAALASFPYLHTYVPPLVNSTSTICGGPHPKQ
jgi:hypothetical protein